MFLLFAFLAPLSRAGLSILVFMIPLLWFVDKMFFSYLKAIVHNRYLLAIAVFLVFVSLSVLWSSDIYEAFNILGKYYYWVLIFVIATTLRYEQIQQVISAFLAGMFVSEIIAYGIFFELWQFKNIEPSNPTPFMNHIDYGVFLSLSSIVLLQRVISSVFSFKERIMYFFFFVTVTGNLFLTAGKTGYLSLIMAIVVLFVVKYKFTMKSIVLPLVFLGLILSMAFNLSNTFKLRMLLVQQEIVMIQQGNFSGGSLGARISIWLIGYRNFTERPILGHGVGGYEASFLQKIDRENSLLEYSGLKDVGKKHAHNQYIQFLVQFGLVGFILFGLILYYLIKLIDDEYRDLSILFVTVFLTCFISETLFQRQFDVALWVLMSGIFAVVIQNQDFKNYKDTKEKDAKSNNC